MTESNEGRRDHVGARAELAAVSDEVMRLVELLDGLNRYRFGPGARVAAGPRRIRARQHGTSSAETELAFTAAAR